MSLRKLFVTTAVCAAALAGAPRSASADWVFTPFVGWNFNGSADVTGSGGASFNNQFEHKIDYGISIAQMGAGVLGWEVDFGYSPNFYETGTASNNTFDFTNDSNVTTLTGNVIVGIPAGGHGASIRPYAVGGVGLIRSNVQDTAGFFDVTTKNDFGLDVGAGVMGFVSQNVGIRGDVRYFRGFRGAGNDAGLGLSNFNYWRGTVGVSFKF